MKSPPPEPLTKTDFEALSLHDFFVGHEAARVARDDARLSPRVGDLMTSGVRTARPQQALVELMALFSDGGRHHLPVVDDHHRLVGMVTRSDVVAALFRAGREQPAALPTR